MLRSTLITIATAGLACATAAGAQTFSFETPNANFVSYNPTGYAGVTFNNNSGVAIQGSLFGVNPPDGTQAAFIQSSFDRGVGTISFALTGLSATTAYTTSFFAATAPDYGYSPTTSGPTTPLTISFDGIALGVYSATSVNFTQFNVPNFVATGTTGTLTFSGTLGVYGTTLLDLVTVKAVSGVTPVTPTAGAVPEPATWAMMIGGFGLIGGTMRRRRTAVHFA